MYKFHIFIIALPSYVDLSKNPYFSQLKIWRISLLLSQGKKGEIFSRPRRSQYYIFYTPQVLAQILNDVSMPFSECLLRTDTWLGTNNPFHTFTVSVPWTAFASSPYFSIDLSGTYEDIYYNLPMCLHFSCFIMDEEIIFIVQYRTKIVPSYSQGYVTILPRNGTW